MMPTFTKIEEIEIVSIKKLIEFHYDNAVIRLPDQLKSFLETHGIITGGITASVADGGPPNDIDVYLMSKEAVDAFRSAVTSASAGSLLMEHIKSVNQKYPIETIVDGKLVTANATTFEGGLQVITMDTSDMRKHFDMIHCMPWYSLSHKQFHISRAQYDSIKSKKVVQNPLCKPGISKRRLQKYVDRGWTYNIIEDEVNA